MAGFFTLHCVIAALVVSGVGAGNGAEPRSTAPGGSGTIAAPAADAARALVSPDAVEHQRLILEDGSRHGAIASGNSTSVMPTSEQLAILRDPARRVTSVHNHPNNAPLSAGDLGTLSWYPGLAAIAVTTPDGSAFGAQLGDDRATLAYLQGHRGQLVDWADHARYASLAALNLNGAREADVALAQHVANLALDEAGVITYAARPMAGTAMRYDAFAARITRVLPDLVKQVRATVAADLKSADAANARKPAP